MGGPGAEDKDRALQTARTLEKHGRIDPAVQLLREHGLLEEAVRILSAQRRFMDAAQMVIGHLGVTPAQVNTLDAEKKKLARLAAVCFGRANATREAVEWFVALKEIQRAAELLEKAGDTVGAAKLLGASGKKTAAGVAASAVSALPSTNTAQQGAVNHETARRLEDQGKHDLALSAYVQLRRFADAGRMAAALGKMGDAGGFYAEAGLPFEAGAAYAEFGNGALAVDNYVRLPRGDPRYRQACVEVIKLTLELSSISLKMDNFLAQFIESGPRTPKEQEGFYILAKVYEKHDLIENAKEVLHKLLASNAGYRDAAARLQALEGSTQLTSQQHERILTSQPEEERARKSAFPDLPPLDSGPAQVVPSAPRPMTLMSVSPLAAQGQRGRAAPAVVPAENRVGGLQYSTDPGRQAASEQVLSRTVGQNVENIARELATGVPAVPASPAASGGRNTLFSATGSPAPTPPPASVPAPPQGPLELVPGTIVAERYRLVTKLGEGGTAVVFRATDLELNDDIVLKVFHTLLDDQALARFRQELALSRQLVHPNIVRLYDLGAYRGHRYITMELLVGADLKGKLGKGLKPKQALDVLIQACAGLKAAHDRGIIHRDIKPDNIFVTDTGVVKVMDFGIAKAQAAKGVTVAGMIAGTPEYMAPEQINNFTQVTGATDQYALGITAYEMFTGRLPFAHADLVPLLMMHVSERPPPPRTINPTLPAPLEAIVLKCLAKNPADRFPDCGELGKAYAAIHAKL